MPNMGYLHMRPNENDFSSDEQEDKASSMGNLVSDVTSNHRRF